LTGLDLNGWFESIGRISRYPPRHVHRHPLPGRGLKVGQADGPCRVDFDRWIIGESPRTRVHFARLTQGWTGTCQVDDIPAGMGHPAVTDVLGGYQTIPLSGHT